MSMPKVNTEIDTSNMSHEWKDILKIVVKKNGCIRATKPKIDDSKPYTGKAAYVWRMVVFMVSSKPVHNCIPCTADFDIPAYVNGKWSSAYAREISKELDVLVDVIVDSVDKKNWHGVHRWGKAFGYL